MPLATNLAAVEYSTLMLFNFTVYKSFYQPIGLYVRVQ